MDDYITSFHRTIFPSVPSFETEVSFAFSYVQRATAY